MAQFRFMDLDIWKESIALEDKILDISDILEENKKFRFAEQLRGASLSISNNITEGAGSYSTKDFAHFLNIARRSVFEVVNILIVLNRRSHITDELTNQLLADLEILSRKISNFRKSLI